MIRKFPYEGEMYAECDSIRLPFWNISMVYTDRNSIPFLFGKDKEGKWFVLLGKKGDAHNELIWDNVKALKGISMDRRNYLLGRLWIVHSLIEGAPFGIVTVWDGDCPIGYSDSKCFGKIKSLLKEKRIDISEFEIINEHDRDIYSVTVDEYISLNLQSTQKIPVAYERQQKISKKGYHDKFDAFDYKGNGVGRLGYHLTAYMDENKTIKNNTKMDKRILDEKKLEQLVYECTMDYINSTPELKKRILERREMRKKSLAESKRKQVGVTYDMLFEMVKKTVKTMMK